MEGCNSGDAVGHRNSGAKRKRAGHAITLRTHLAVLGNRGLLVEPADECLGIGHLCLLVQRLSERPQLLHWRLNAGFRGRGFLEPIELICDQHRIARLGEPFGHLTVCGPQSDNIWPHQNTWCSAADRMHEVAVRGTVLRHDVHVSVGYGDRVGHLRQHHGDAGSQHDTELPPRYHQTESLVVLLILLKMVLIAHICSLSMANRVAGAHAYRDLLYAFEVRARKCEEREDQNVGRYATCGASSSRS